MRSIVCWAACVMVFASICSAAAPDGSTDYLNGMDALAAGRFADAEPALRKAIDADEENPDYRIAHAVALIFCEKLPQAEADLNRALKLKPNDDTARLWLATDVAMQAQWMKDSDIYPFAVFGKEYENAVRRMSHDYGGWVDAQRDAAQADGSRDPNQSDRGRAYLRAKAQFPPLAAGFVQRSEQAISADPAWAELLKQRAIRSSNATASSGNPQVGGGQSNDLATQLVSHPSDTRLLIAHATQMLRSGAPSLARTEATAAATIDPTLSDAYLVRAAAAAALGDTQRASADATIAAALKPGAAPAAPAPIGPPPVSANDLPRQLEQLRRMAHDGADFESLVTQAEAIVKGEAILRRRYDETYQDRLRVLRSAAQQSPNDAQKLAELGSFLYRGAIDVPGEVVEPRASFRYYRRMDLSIQQAELADAERQVDAALQIDPNHLLAVATKAEALMRRLQYADAETLVKQALAHHGNDPTLMDLFSRIMENAANLRNAKANALRTPEHWEDAMYYYTRYPSQAELQQADEFDNQANQLWSLASDAMNASAKALAGTAQGAAFSAIIAERNGDLDGAITDYQQAIQLSPNDARYHNSLGDLYEQKGLAEDALEQHVVGLNLVQTSAAPLLRAAWPQIVMTRFKTARKYLARALQIDPADPRSLAYLGMIEQADNRLDDAKADFSAALALHEAGGRLKGWAGAAPAAGLVPPSVYGLQMAVGNRLAQLDLDSGDLDGALRAAQLAVTDGSHVAPPARYIDLASSMLPGETVDETTVMPAAQNTATLLCYACVYAGDALTAQGKHKEALGVYAAALRCKTEVPPTVDVGMPIRLPAARAALAIGKEYLRQGNGAAAVQTLSNNGVPINLDRPLWQEYNDTMNQAVQVANQQMQR